MRGRADDLTSRGEEYCRLCPAGPRSAVPPPAEGSPRSPSGGALVGAVEHVATHAVGNAQKWFLRGQRDAPLLNFHAA